MDGTKTSSEAGPGCARLTLEHRQSTLPLLKGINFYNNNNNLSSMHNDTSI
uniref:Uncharacterized protein n=1 Tax=Anguilla anguilla TaxID=7936 RepID=A0A0E9R2Z0_ANGAN